VEVREMFAVALLGYQAPAIRDSALVYEIGFQLVPPVLNRYPVV
jgi:hypothetical protein